MKKLSLILALVALVTSSLSADENEFASPTIDLGIVVSDLEKSLAFYTEAVGFTRTGEFTAGKDLTRDSGLSAGEELVIQTLTLGKGPGATTIKLMQPKDSPKETDQTYITSSLGFSYLTIRVTSTKTALARLKKAGVKVLAKGPAMLPGNKVALTVVKDPDGNFVELVGPADHQ
jgi:catechol 2,3-dioxygenase-like lactoylglutathione lyase family enzyme